MMKYGWPSVVWPKSRISTMFSCAIMWIARASLKKRDDDVRVARQDRVQHLDRDLAADDRVLGQVDHAHPPLAEEARDPVVPDGLVDQAGGRGGHDRDPLKPRRSSAENLKILTPGAHFTPETRRQKSNSQRFLPQRPSRSGKV